MTQSNDYPLLHPTRIDIPLDIRAHLITLPNSNHLYVQAEQVKDQVERVAGTVKDEVKRAVEKVKNA